MKIKITESQLRRLSTILLEYEAYPYTEYGKNDSDRIQYTFKVDDMNYYVIITKYHNNIYNLTFKVDDKPYSYETKKDFKHFNNVMYTVVDNILLDAVKKYGISKIKFSGEPNQDENLELLEPSIRFKSYMRYIKQNYPNVKITSSGVNSAIIDLESMLPEYFDKSYSDKQKLINVLTSINSDNFDESWSDDINVDTNTGYITAYISDLNSDDYGYIEIDIYYDNDYFLTLTTEDDEINETFSSFDDLINFLEMKFDIN